MQEKQDYIWIRSNIKNVYIHLQDGKIIVKTPKSISKTQIDEIVRKKKRWIENGLKKLENRQERKEQYTQEEFIKVIEKNVKQLIQITGLKPNRIRVKEIRYAWGSCSTKKNITINQKLICYSEMAIRYVILHELCHLKFMNHGQDFWNLVEMHMPNYKIAKKELKE